MNKSEPKTPQKKRKPDSMPVGIVLIIILIALGISGYLFPIFMNSPMVLGPVVLTGASALLLNLIFISIYVAMLVGVIKRKEWGRKLVMFWAYFQIVLISINLIISIFFPEILINVMKKSMKSMMAPGQEYPSEAMDMVFSQTFLVITNSVTFIFSVAISLAVILYLKKQKKFFVN